MKTLLALDPGGTTGVSIWQYDFETPLTHVAHHQITDGIDGFIKFLLPDGKPLPFDVIVYENFRLDGRTPNPNVDPLRIEGVISVYEHLMDVPTFAQGNGMKAHVDNDRLKQHNLYWPGQQHAMDSARHALAFMKRTAHMPTLLKYFGPVE
jgi:hypothetical protein